MTPEQEYYQLLERLVNGAKKIENPLLSDDKRAEYMALYDQIENRIMELKKVLFSP